MKNPIKQATKAFEKLESQFEGDSDNHYLFWDRLCYLIEDKLVELEVLGKGPDEQEEHTSGEKD